MRARSSGWVFGQLAQVVGGLRHVLEGTGVTAPFVAHAPVVDAPHREALLAQRLGLPGQQFWPGQLRHLAAAVDQQHHGVRAAAKPLGLLQSELAELLWRAAVGQPVLRSWTVGAVEHTLKIQQWCELQTLPPKRWTASFFSEQQKLPGTPA